MGKLTFYGSPDREIKDAIRDLKGVKDVTIVVDDDCDNHLRGAHPQFGKHVQHGSIQLIGSDADVASALGQLESQLGDRVQRANDRTLVYKDK